MRKVLALAVVAGLLIVAACDTADTTAPTVSIVLPAGGDTLAKGSIVITAIATDNKAVAKVEFYADGSILGTDNVGGAGDTFRYTWSDTAAQTAGSHTLAAKAYDNASTPNMTTSANVNIVIAGGGGGTGPTHHAGQVAADETWWPSGNPHILDSDVWPGDNVTITIKPGCIIKLDAGVEFYVGYSGPGSIIAEGTADSTILFTSNVASPAPGDWIAVEVYDKAMSTTSFKYCTFEYGGSSANYGSFLIDGFGLKFSNNTVRKSAADGVRLRQNGYFTECDNNTITECADYPLYIAAEYVRTIGTGTNLAGNAKSGVFIGYGNVTTTGTWQNLGVPYIVSTDVNIGDDNNSPVLTIAPGTTIELQNGKEFYCGHAASGGLIADGTSGRITFTSSVPTPSRGDW